MKFSEYETVNPGQDFDDHEMELFDPPAEAVTGEEVRRPNVAAETSEQAIQAVISGDPLSISGSRTTGSRASRANGGLDDVVEIEKEKKPRSSVSRD